VRLWSTKGRKRGVCAEKWRRPVIENWPFKKGVALRRLASGEVRGTSYPIRLLDQRRRTFHGAVGRKRRER